MKRKVLLAICLGISLLPALTVYGQTESRHLVSLESFIQEACRRDSNFQAILIDELFLRYKKALRIPAGDFLVSVKNQYNTFLSDRESEVSNSLSLNQLFPYAGLSVGADYASRVNSSTRAITSELDTFISLPIAENAFGFSTRLLDKIVGAEIEVAGHQIVEAYEDYLASLIQVYLDWYSAYKNVETAQNSYKENIKLLENIKERQKSSIALPIDVNKVKVQVLAKEENLTLLKNQYARYHNAIKEAIRADLSAELIPDSPSLYDDVVIDFDLDYDLFIKESRTYKLFSLLEAKSSLQVDRDAHKLLPSLELRLGYLLEGREYGLEKGRRTIYAGATLDWPFLGQLERAEYETSKINLKRQQLLNRSAHASLYTSLRDIHEAIERERQLIVLADEKIKLAEMIVEDETHNYSYGKVTLKDYIDEINKLEDNKFNKISHTIQLRKLLVEWLRLTDRLVEKNAQAM